MNPNVSSRQFFRKVGDALSPMSVAPWASADGGTKPVRLSTLQATQEHLDAARVQHYVDNPSSDPITVLRTGNNHTSVYDGHHRAAAAMSRGETTITAKVRGTGGRFSQ